MVLYDKLFETYPWIFPLYHCIQTGNTNYYDVKGNLDILEKNKKLDVFNGSDNLFILNRGSIVDLEDIKKFEKSIGKELYNLSFLSASVSTKVAAY